MKSKYTKGQYGYLKSRKTSLMLQFAGVVLLAVAIFFVGLLLNKWEASNIFTVVSIVMVLPAAKILVVLIVVFPHKQMPIQEKEMIDKLLKPTDTVYYDPVFTSSERPMHLDAIIVTSHQVIGYTSSSKDKIGKINDYFKKEFDARQLGFVAFITDSEKALNNRIRMRNDDETASEKQLVDMKEVNDFIRTAIV